MRTDTEVLLNIAKLTEQRKLIWEKPTGLGYIAKLGKMKLHLMSVPKENSAGTEKILCITIPFKQSKDIYEEGHAVEMQNLAYVVENNVRTTVSLALDEELDKCCAEG